MLERHRDTPTVRLKTEVETRYIVERGLQLAIQNVLDLGMHILAGLGRGQIETYFAEHVTRWLDRQGASS